MELSSLSNYGIAAIFIFASWKLYTDTKYKPDDVFKQQFVDKEAKLILKDGGAKTLAEAKVKAQGRLDLLLDKSGDGFGSYL